MAIKSKSKSTDELTKQNLNRLLNKLKIRVAEKEEIWLEMFEYMLPLVVPEGENLESKHILTCSLLVDTAIAEYETRWGS